MVLCNDYLADNFAPYTSRVVAGDDPRLRRPRLVDRRDGAHARPREPRVLRVGDAVRGPFAGAPRGRPVLARVHRPRDDRGAAHRQHAGPLRGRLGRRRAGTSRAAPGWPGSCAFANSQRTRGGADVPRRAAVRRHVHAESRRDGRARRAVGELAAVVRVTARDARRRERRAGGVAARAVAGCAGPHGT